jgi:acetoin utilization deacetylase AcuC-like enzyme
VSGYLENVTKIKARSATEEELLGFHTQEYVDKVKNLSSDRGGDTGEQVQFGKGSYEIALLSAGGVLSGIEAIARGEVKNCYALVRPPGHHATASCGMGFCLFNNIVLGALRARKLGYERIAIVDYDVHHGNGTQEAFWSDPLTLFISIHQGQSDCRPCS